MGDCVPIQRIALSLDKMNQSRDLKCGLRSCGATESKQRLFRMKRELTGFLSPDQPAEWIAVWETTSQPTFGGPRCLKYGVTRDYVLGLEVVLADGKLLQLGGRTHKNKTGFDLHRIFVGSEGLLGIVTQQHSNASSSLQSACRLASTTTTAASILGRVFKQVFCPVRLKPIDSPGGCHRNAPAQNVSRLPGSSHSRTRWSTRIGPLGPTRLEKLIGGFAKIHSSRPWKRRM